MSKELANKQESAIMTLDPGVLLTKALESGASVEVMEKLLAMRSGLVAEQAKQAFISAMSGFQAECPIIEKKRKIIVKGQVRSHYASLDDILDQISPLLEKYGLSYTTKTESGDKSVTATTVVYHVMGHSEDSSFSVPIESEAYMNDAQKAGSSLTYAKRYSFMNAFGILTGDQDDDAQALGKGINPQDLYKKFRRHMDALLNNFETVLAVKDFLCGEDYDAAAEAWAEINEHQTLMALGLAYTKGGCFTVEEGKRFQTKEFKEAYSKHREGRVYTDV